MRYKNRPVGDVDKISYNITLVLPTHTRRLRSCNLITDALGAIGPFINHIDAGVMTQSAWNIIYE